MIENLLHIFPNAQISQPPTDKIASYLTFQIEQQKIYIPIEGIDSQHQALLHLLVNKSIQSADFQLSPTHQQWLYTLTHGEHHVHSNHYLQVFYLFSKGSLHEFDFNLWQTTLLHAFPSIQVIIPIHPQQIILVISHPEINSATSLVSEIISSLNIDFGITIKGMAGLPHHQQQIHLWYPAELILSQKESCLSLPQTISSVSQILLYTSKTYALTHNELAQHIQHIIQMNSDYTSTIQALFDNNGKLSQTAEQLYIHRNTLNNRLQKFYRETGLDIQIFADLTLSYLLL